MGKRVLFFLGLSFIEGACVMAAELLGAKLLAPFYGSSLYVWSSVMAVTLMGLALGYFIGGHYSTKPNTEKRLYKVMVVGACIIALMPFTAQLCFALFSSLSLLPSVLISAIVLLVPPVFLMGMVSPLIISTIDVWFNNPGKSSGTVYAISTLGGILATFSFGFYVIPNFGLHMPCIATAILLGCIPLVMLFKAKNILPLLLIGSIWFAFKVTKVNNYNTRIKILALREGVLGQLLVVDFPNDYYYGDPARKGQTSRWLYVNRISQTMDDKHANVLAGEERYFTYVYKIAEVLEQKKVHGKNVLLLGLGGGSVANFLTSKGYVVEACELDERIYGIAQEFFGLNKKVSVTIDDARHFINTCKKKYDIIIFDTFKGEETPNHVLTKESLIRVKEMLRPNGLVFVNSFGYWKGKRGKGMRSIYKTFSKNGFYTVVKPTAHDENQRNLLFIASPFSKPLHDSTYLNIEPNALRDSEELTDAKPVFEKMNTMAALSWRKATIQTFLYDSLQRQMPFFY